MSGNRLESVQTTQSNRSFDYLAYAQLLRLPNVFTALADIGLAWVAAAVVGSRPGWPVLLLLAAASGCLYLAGMVWNDIFDMEQDRRERPFRPLPSGRVRLQNAAWLGANLLLLGIAFAGAAAWEAGSWNTILLAVVLALMILVYDGWAKRFWLGPIAMGACRFLNVLLGLSVAAVDPKWAAVGWHLALVVAVYIAGVTWFARTEAGKSSRAALAGAALVMLASLVLGLLWPAWLPPGTSSPAFPYLLVGFGFLVGLPVSHAMNRPVPKNVQLAVKRAVLGVIILDAILATALVGVAGLTLMLLWLPARFLGKWLYST